MCRGAVMNRAVGDIAMFLVACECAPKCEKIFNAIDNCQRAQWTQ